jgi:hypothetical protein
MKRMSIGEKMLWSTAFEAEYRRYVEMTFRNRTDVIMMQEVADVSRTGYRKAIDAAASRVMAVREARMVYAEEHANDIPPMVMLDEMLDLDEQD